MSARERRCSRWPRPSRDAVGRCRIRDWFYRLISPLATPFAGVDPNVITGFAALTGCGAGVAYALTGRSPAWFVVGAALVLLSGLADALDGIVARQQDRATVLGDFLDHFFDRVVEAAVMVGLAVSRGATPPLGVAATLAVVLNSYLGTQIHASFGRRDYTGLGKGQFIAGLVVGSVLLAVFPDAAIDVAGMSMSGVDVLLGLIGVLAVQAMVHRLRLAVRLARTGRDAE